MCYSPKPVFKRQCSSGCVRAAGTIKNLPHYLRVKYSFRSENRESWWEGSELDSPGFYRPLCSSSPPPESNLPHLREILGQVGRAWPTHECKGLCPGAPDSLSGIFVTGRMIKYHIVISACPLNPHNEILSHYIR